VVVASVEIRPTSVAEVRMHPRVLLDNDAESGGVYAALDIDWATYTYLEQAGRLLLLGAWEGDDLVGYAICVRGRMLHRDIEAAQGTVIYVAPDARRKGVAMRLIREVQRMTVADGGRMVTWKCGERSPLATILPKLGYRKLETEYGKEF